MRTARAAPPRSPGCRRSTAFIDIGNFQDVKLKGDAQAFLRALVAEDARVPLRAEEAVAARHLRPHRAADGRRHEAAARSRPMSRILVVATHRVPDARQDEGVHHRHPDAAGDDRPLDRLSDLRGAGTRRRRPCVRRDRSARACSIRRSCRPPRSTTQKSGVGQGAHGPALPAEPGRARRARRRRRQGGPVVDACARRICSPSSRFRRRVLDVDAARRRSDRLLHRDAVVRRAAGLAESRRCRRRSPAGASRPRRSIAAWWRSSRGRRA